MTKSKNKPCFLALEDGLVLEGKSFGEIGETGGEVVFNTSMTGYQEILTDPSYAGQIVTMTYPLIGNYGVNSDDYESRASFAEGFIVREASDIYSNWKASTSLDKFLTDFGIVGIQGIDTRMLTRHIRSYGAMKGIVSSVDLDKESLIKKTKALPGLIGKDMVKDVTTSESYTRKPLDGAVKFKVAAFDFGIKLNILRSLLGFNCQVEVVPADTSAEEILKLNPDGIFLSNGPGDPEGVPYVIEIVKELIGRKPIFGICLGHQILSLALGLKTYKLKFGHHGGNHPVKNLETEKIEITAQNHGFAVHIDDLGKIVETETSRVKVTHINLNDNTIEGIKCFDVPAFSVQYHPESSPGPHDSLYLFEQFIDLMKIR
ncbi:MAG: glutamine-hydrolyzing carbamoyl-phosphate synthase small subunit [Actinobacteria bacterium]|nr:glutamine-hydrolyzing carbamoyl-phosphate synthase small subunit [Actinomycetota bacterium]